MTGRNARRYKTIRPTGARPAEAALRAGRLACPCGFVYDLSPIPDDGWVTVRDKASECQAVIPSMAYDKAKFHYDGDFPTDLAPENGGTHIGMFLAWAIQRGLVSEELIEDAAGEIEAVRERRKTGRDLLFTYLDQGIGEDDLNDEGNAFAESYYASNAYLRDYEKLFAKRYPTCYHADDTWENFDLVAEMIDKRYKKWKGKRGESAAG